MKRGLILLLTVILCLGLIACNKPVEFNINFVVDGSLYDTVSTTNKENITMPKNPAKEGYAFEGWYWDNGKWEKPFTVNSLLDAPLSSDMSVYAKWTHLVHQEIVDEAVAPTCTATGFTEGKHCSECKEILVAQTIVNALGHTAVVTPEVAPTCTDTGLTEGKHCSVCNEVIVAQTVVDALGHTEVVDEAVAPTCTATGLTAGKHCSACNGVIVAQTVVDAIGHTEVIDAAVAPTCAATGLTEGKHCSVCDTILVSQKTVSATGKHTYEYTVNDPGATNVSIIYFCTVCDDTYNVTPTDFTITSSNLEMIGYTGDESETLVIPVLFENNGTWYKVVAIDNKAFCECSNLTSITIPDSVTSIGNYAFSYCSSLTSITIPDSVISIGNSVFSYCSSLTNITIPDGVTSIGASMFAYCSSLTSITIPNGVTSIGGSAFYDCGSLKSITLSDTVKSIGFTAFYNCCSLTSITIPNSVTSISGMAFAGCDALTSITIPNSVTSIGECAFSYCDNLTSINVDAKNSRYTSIDGNLYTKNGKTLIQYARGKSDTSFTIPNSVTSIGDSAFIFCTSLTSIIIPDSVTSIGDSAFYGCYSLKSVTFENTDGWWRASYSSATSGTSISATNLADPTTAATYLTSTYREYYWHRT